MVFFSLFDVQLLTFGNECAHSGTGKSFIGALAAKVLLTDPSTRILVLSYTNHALDQFLEDLIGVGIPPDDMTRLGYKSTPKTACLSFEAQFAASGTRNSTAAWHRINSLKREASEHQDKINFIFSNLKNRVSSNEILGCLEFSEDPEDQKMWDAFQVPTADDGFSIAGANRQRIGSDAVFNRWKMGQGPGTLKPLLSPTSQFLWSIPGPQRTQKVAEWVRSLQKERVEQLESAAERQRDTQEQIDSYFNESKCTFIAQKRIIGCTTTAAAKYSYLINAAKANCVLVEEAGEILEAHILTALSPTTKQLILIGDHKQLRPKYKNYDLSVEKGEGYDFNKSMFERLISQGHPHVTLRNQHRMHPEISQIVREMTYP